MNEFDIIRTYFAPLSKDGLSNDAAVIDIPNGFQMVVTTDTLNAGRHFMLDASPDNIARKALRTNISDLYAMGARPLCYQLSIAYPEKPEQHWLETFARALKIEQEQFGLYCSGGDTTVIHGALSISITAIGCVESGKAWTRSGAEEGDAVVISGCVGDAWIGLQILQGELNTDDNDYFVQQYYAPTLKRINDNGTIKAAIDVSDGFMADLGHICTQSGVGAVINSGDVKFSKPAQNLIKHHRVTPQTLLTGGDDYKIIMAYDPLYIPENVVRIGTFTGAAHDIKVIDHDNAPLVFDQTGWTHF